MKKYVAFSIVNKVKFYLNQSGEWHKSYDNLRIFLDDQVGRYFDVKQRKHLLKTNFSQLLVEEYSNEKQ